MPTSSLSDGNRIDETSDRAAVREQPAGSAAKPSAHRLRVLLLEDRPEDAELIVHYLRQAGFEPEVRRVDREQEFRAALSPEVDIVLADFALPDFDGLRALDLVAQSGLAIPFILVSGSVGEERAVEVMRRGAADYILKDRMARLGAAVARALENARLQRQFDGAVTELKKAERQYRSLVEQLPAVTYMVQLGAPGRTVYISPQIEAMLGVSPQAWMADPGLWKRVIHPEDREWVVGEIQRRDAEGHPLDLEYRMVAIDERVLWVRNQSVVVRDAEGQPLYSHGVLFDITGRKEAEGEILRRSLELDALYRIGKEMARLAEPAQILEMILTLVGEVLDNRNFTIALYDQERNWVDFPIRVENGVRQQAAGREFSNRITERVLHSRKPVLLNGDVQQAIRDLGIETSGPPASSYLGVPILAGDRTLGMIAVWDLEREGAYTERDSDLLTTIAAQAAVSLENTRLFDETRRRLEHLQALRSIDIAISGSVDLRVTLDIVLGQVLTHLKVDAADILHLNRDSRQLEYTVGKGFRTSALRYTRLRVGEGHAGQAALDRRIVHVEDLEQRPESFSRSSLLKAEGFHAYFGVPLVAKGQLKGVLEVFFRQPVRSDSEWLHFLEALAGQAAIAMDNAELFEGLERSNVDLRLAYDRTLEGWSRALDLRDQETEGHTQRVVEMTIRLARALSVRDEEMVHLRRGALLHDIGKMGIPDSILLKPGPLTEEEWAIMRKHPTYAYEMLAPISYLGPALDVPYCHHEKWDGTGYPRGLRGEAVPYQARIFAVADVWDALRSDRPYRKGWQEAEALKYVQDQIGRHFEPAVAKTFLDGKLYLHD